MHLSKTSIDKLVLNVSHQMHMLATSHGVKIDVAPQIIVSGDPLLDVSELIADQLHISQIVSNLLSNAIKFSPPGGRVSIAVKVTGTSEVKHSANISKKSLSYLRGCRNWFRNVRAVAPLTSTVVTYNGASGSNHSEGVLANNKCSPICYPVHRMVGELDPLQFVHNACLERKGSAGSTIRMRCLTHMLFLL